MFSIRFTTARDFRTDWYRRWKHQFGLTDKLNRKWWEIAVVAETLSAHGALASGKRGVGFGVGSEPEPKVFADFGSEVVATDLLKPEWSHEHQRFNSNSQHDRVTTRTVDMNWIDGGSGVQSIEEGTYDFSWSICSMDHCGSVWLTKRFLLNQMNCLRVGGIAAHTAEYTISLGLPREGDTVWLDWEDVVDIVTLLSQLGHEVAPVDWNIGDSIEDHCVDPHPWKSPVHLKPEANAGRWATAVCFSIKKTRPGILWIPLDEGEARKAIANCHRTPSDESLSLQLASTSTAPSHLSHSQM